VINLYISYDIVSPATHTHTHTKRICMYVCVCVCVCVCIYIYIYIYIIFNKFKYFRPSHKCNLYKYGRVPIEAYVLISLYNSGLLFRVHSISIQVEKLPIM
jgi:hypothetical protein